MATKGYLMLLGGMREIERILKERMHEDEETIEQNGVPLLVESMADQIDELKAQLEARPVEAKTEAGLRENVAIAIHDFENSFRRPFERPEWVEESDEARKYCYDLADRILAISRPAPAAGIEGPGLRVAVEKHIVKWYTRTGKRIIAHDGFEHGDDVECDICAALAARPVEGEKK